MIVETEQIKRIRTIAHSLRALSKRTRRVYGGSDFSPVDYEVPNFSPTELTRLVDDLDAALENQLL